MYDVLIHILQALLYMIEPTPLRLMETSFTSELLAMHNDSIALHRLHQLTQHLSFEEAEAVTLQ